MNVSAIALLLAAASAVAEPHFDVRPVDALIDEPVAISINGLAAGSDVTIRLDGPHSTSSATFAAGANGVVDVTRTAPLHGDYAGVDPMGLFWSAHHDASARQQRERVVNATVPPAEVWRLTASVNGAAVANTAITRRAVAPGVMMTAVHDRGMAAVFYRPPDEGRHPAIIVLSGSGGGLMPASAFPGGLASRGYAVLSLAYFGVEGLPPSLHDIPLEYFRTALEWLASQPSVDPKRVGVLGISRGGELALLLGSTFPQIRTVVAYLPSNIVVGGCCSGRSEASWTVGGRPLAWSFPARQDPRAEIRVEQIHGAVLLISGRSDRVWPSTEMSNAVMARLDRNHFAYPHEHLAYADAGHAIGRPYTSTMDVDHVVHPLTGRVISLGGTPAGTAKAREDSWRHMLTFLEQNLRALK